MKYQYQFQVDGRAFGAQWRDNWFEAARRRRQESKRKPDAPSR